MAEEKPGSRGRSPKKAMREHPKNRTRGKKAEPRGSEPFTVDVSKYQIEGLEPVEVYFINAAFVAARIERVRRSDGAFNQAQQELEKSFEASDVGFSFDETAFQGAAAEYSRVGLLGDTGFFGEPGSFDEEKFAVRVALNVLAGTSPQVLANAMGAALSTLYAYSDAGRPNRPGQKRLYQAAFLFSRFADEMRSTSDYLVKVARRSSPSRAQTKTLPRTIAKSLKPK